MACSVPVPTALFIVSQFFDFTSVICLLFCHRTFHLTVSKLNPVNTKRQSDQSSVQLSISALTQCRRSLLILTVFFPKSVALFVISLIASATSAHALYGYCYTTRDCSVIGVKVDNPGIVPSQCSSFLAGYRTNLHEDAQCLVAGYAVEVYHCGTIPDRDNKEYAIRCVSMLP